MDPSTDHARTSSDFLGALSICLVGPLPPPAGGMANQTRQLQLLLDEAGSRVEVVAVNATYRPAWLARVKGLRALARLVPYAWRLWRAIGRADVVHVMANSGWAWHLFAAPAVWIGAARGTPVVVNYRGGEAEPFLAKQARVVLPTLARASAVVVPSGFLAAVFAQHGVTTEVVRNIINLDRFQPAENANHEPHIIVTRNLEEIYGIATAIRAFAIVRERYPRARLTVAGTGPLEGPLRQLAKECGVADGVTFCGQIDNREIPALYRSADLLFNPSRVDNMPISLLEAMASGVPIVSTKAGGIPFMVEDGVTAMLVDIDDHQAMADAALRIIDEPARAQSMRAAGLASVDAYTWDRVRPALQSVYARVARQRRA